MNDIIIPAPGPVRTWSFVVDIPLKGYQRPRDHSGKGRYQRKDGTFSPGYREYSLWKADVFLLAMSAGYRKLTPTHKRPARLGLFISWKGRPRIDWPNVYKAVEDSLFDQDRYVVPASTCGMKWDTGAPTVALVQIEDMG